MPDNMAEAAVLDEPVASAPQDLTPVSALERIELIDILRGFALFGVLIANMKGFSLPMNAYFGFGGEWPSLSPLDKAIDQFILFAIKGKFLALFSFLFGLGLSVQLMRAQARGVSVVPRYMRRLSVLLLFGAAHVLFFWFGDILHTYALAGFLLLLFRNLSVKALERIILIVLMFLMVGGFGGFIAQMVRPSASSNSAQQQKQQQERKLKMDQMMKEEVRIISTGSYGEQVLLRARQWKDLYLDPGTAFYFGALLHLFLMGLYAGKRRVFQEIEQNLPFLRKCMWFGMACGIGGLIRFVPRTPEFPASGFVRGMLGGFSQYVFIFYAAGIVLLVYRSPWWRQKFALLAPVGRMALTNYLTHTLVATTIFYGYGLGYFGKMGSAWGLALSLAIYGLQLPFCAWWLNRHQFGPAEWLWRSLTYGKMQPMKIESSPPQTGAA